MTRAYYFLDPFDKNKSEVCESGNAELVVKATIKQLWIVNNTNFYLGYQCFLKGVDKKGEKSLIHAIPKEHKLHPFFLADSEPISHICLTREYFVVIKEPASDPKSKTLYAFHVNSSYILQSLQVPYDQRFLLECFLEESEEYFYLYYLDSGSLHLKNFRNGYRLKVGNMIGEDWYCIQRWPQN